MELLIFAVDRPFSTRRELVERYMRGDVVIAKPDGWPWSQRELTNPDWRILRVGLLKSETDALSAAETDISGIKTLKRKRRRKLDLDSVSIPARLRNYLNDDTRAVPILALNAVGDATLVRSLEYVRPDGDSGQE